MTIHNNKFYHQLSKVAPLDESGIEEGDTSGHDGIPRTRCKIQVSRVTRRCRVMLTCAENGRACDTDCGRDIRAECDTRVLCVFLSARVRHTCEWCSISCVMCV
jgi:hypothetical protein